MIPLVDGVEEVWVPVKGYEGFYEVSSLGGIKCLQRKQLMPEGRHNHTWVRVRKEKVYYAKEGKGYIVRTLYKENSTEPILLHRLVAQAFIPNPDNLPEVNHKNGFKWDNRAVNLEWVDRKGNALHSVNVLQKNRGSQTGTSKLKEEDVLEIFNLLKEGKMKQTDIAKSFNVSNSCIYRISKGYNWRWLWFQNSDRREEGV